jgi:Cupin domain
MATMAHPPTIRPATAGPRIAVVGDVYRFLAVGDETDGKYAMFEAFVPPGGGPPPHVHGREEESFYVLAGRATFQAGDEPFVAGAGTSKSAWNAAACAGPWRAPKPCSTSAPCDSPPTGTRSSNDRRHQTAPGHRRLSLRERALVRGATGEDRAAASRRAVRRPFGGPPECSGRSRSRLAGQPPSRWAVTGA